MSGLILWGRGRAQAAFLGEEIQWSPILGLAHHTGGPAVSGQLRRAGTEKEFYWPLPQRETRREVGPGLRNKGVAMVTHEETHSSRRGKGVECRPPSQDRDKAGCHGDAHSFPCMPGLSPVQGCRNPSSSTPLTLTSPYDSDPHAKHRPLRGSTSRPTLWP